MSTPEPMLPIPFARDQLETHSATMIRASWMLLVISALIAAAAIAVTVLTVSDDGNGGSTPIMIALGPLALSLAGLFLAPQRVKQLRTLTKAKGQALDELEASGATQVAASFVDLRQKPSR